MIEFILGKQIKDFDFNQEMSNDQQNGVFFYKIIEFLQFFF